VAADVDGVAADVNGDALPAIERALYLKPWPVACTDSIPRGRARRGK
jgi:hypothetical protein